MSKTKKISVIVIIIAVILNIILFFINIFPGTYSYTDSKGYTRKITFYENTFSTKSVKDGQIVGTDFGFYQYIPKSANKEAKYNTLILVSKREYATGSQSYKRNSVFSFTLNPESKDKETYTCGWAIFLQVVYGFLIVASIANIIIINRKNNKAAKS